jgi:hypothetical protein
MEVDMTQLYNETSGALIGNITAEQLQFLVDQLEEESLEDTDYSITPMTLDYFEEVGADPGLVSMLRNALGAQDEMIIMWK